MRKNSKLAPKRATAKKAMTKKASAKKSVVDPKRSAAAKKAWKTIRANQRKAKNK